MFVHAIVDMAQLGSISCGRHHHIRLRPRPSLSRPIQIPTTPAVTSSLTPKASFLLQQRRKGKLAPIRAYTMSTTDDSDPMDDMDVDEFDDIIESAKRHALSTPSA